VKGPLPPRPFVGALVARATWLWLGMLLIAAMRPGPLSVIWIWGFVALGVHLVARRRGEALILADLGFSATRTSLLVIAWCALLEGCLRWTA